MYRLGMEGAQEEKSGERIVDREDVSNDNKPADGRLERWRKAVDLVKDRDQLVHEGRSSLRFGFEEAAVLARDYKQQGNLEFYTQENLKKRVKNREHPQVVAEMNRFYNTFVSRLGNRKGRIAKREGVSVTVRICKALYDTEDFVLPEAIDQANEEWVREVSAGKKSSKPPSQFMPRDLLMDSLFETADIW